MTAAMPYATIWDHLDEGGARGIRSDHRLLSPELATLIVAYLKESTLVVRTAMTEPDLFDRQRWIPFARSVFSDGVWYWRYELLWYVEKHHLAPSSTFVEHVRQQNFKPARPDAECIAHLLEQLGLQSASAPYREQPG